MEEVEFNEEQKVKDKIVKFFQEDNKDIACLKDYKIFFQERLNSSNSWIKDTSLLMLNHIHKIENKR